VMRGWIFQHCASIPFICTSNIFFVTSNMYLNSLVKDCYSVPKGGSKGGGVAAGPNHGLGSRLGAKAGGWRLQGGYVATFYNKGLLDLL
jgi:hypothetical protein